MDSTNVGQLAFMGVNFLAWTATYILIAHRSYKDKRAGIPLEAISLMFAFEIVYVFMIGIQLDDPTLQLIAKISEIVWLVLDGVLFATVFIWGAREEDAPPLRANYRFYALSWLVLSIFGVITFVALFDLESSGLFAFMDEALVAIWFVPYVLKRRSLDGISYAGLLTRMTADLAATVALLVFSPWCDIFGDDSPQQCVWGAPMVGNWFVIFLTVSWCFADAVLLIEATKMRKLHRAYEEADIDDSVHDGT